jgi:competence protein ComEA
MKLKLLLVVILSSLVSFTALAATEQTHTKTVLKASEINMVNINNADVKALSGLKGIGKKRAEAIIAYRKTNGNFKSADDLLNVKGISKKVIEENKNRLMV